MIFRVLLLIFLFAGSAFGKYPYDSVARVSTGGSGTLVAVHEDKGLFITNAHVMSSKAEATLYWPAVMQSRKAYTVHVSDHFDIALLVVERPPVKPVPIYRRTSEAYVATGFPYYDRPFLHWQQGKITRDAGSVFIVSRLPVPGMSGGGVFDEHGHLIAMVKGHNDDYGVLVDTSAIYSMVQRYKDPATWVKDGSHVKTHHKGKWNYAKQDGKVRTKKYDEETAPDLK